MKYTVKLFVVRTHEYAVEEESEDLAFNVAREMWAEGDEGSVDTTDDRIHTHDVEEEE